ncbi:MAG: type II secretion system protein GspN [Thermodesulfovibrionales bacterium]
MRTKSKITFTSLISYFLIVSACIFIIFAGVWIVAVPENTIKEYIEQRFDSKSIKLEISGIKKGLFYSISIEKLTLKNNEKEILSLEGISVRIKPAYFILLRLEAAFKSTLRDGIITGHLSLDRNNRFMQARLQKLDIKDIPYLDTIGIKGTGILDAAITHNNNHSDIKFAVNEARLEHIIIAGVNLPGELFSKAKGAVTIDDNTISIDAISLEGQDIFGRIKGKLRDNIADLTLEIMPASAAFNKFPVLALIDRYKVSPGLYVIPIHGLAYSMNK